MVEETENVFRIVTKADRLLCLCRCRWLPCHVLASPPDHPSPQTTRNTQAIPKACSVFNMPVGPLVLTIHGQHCWYGGLGKGEIHVGETMLTRLCWSPPSTLAPALSASALLSFRASERAVRKFKSKQSIDL